MKHFGKFATVALACLLAGSCLAGCGDNHGGKTVVNLWGAAETEEAATFQQVIDDYNNTNTDNIWVEYQPMPSSGYETTIDRTLAGTKGPDVFYVHEKYIKRWAKFGYLECLQPRIDASDIDLSAMWDGAVSRYRYDPVKNTNNPDDPLYCLPKDVSPTALYYNKSIMEKQGIKVISVDEDQIDAFNNEGARDRVGKTKADYGITIDVQKKGFYRENPYSELSGWVKPTYGSDGKVLETMIFNNRIAMSWDEIEDLGMILTKEANPDLKDSKMQWGYFTEWWFNYGWGVGGDCAVDTTGNGDWVFSLGDTEKKYALYNADGSYVYDTAKKNVFVKESEKNTYPLQDGQNFKYSKPLPSQREAFDRFVVLSRSDNNRGVAIAPTPKQLGTSTGGAFFTQGKVAMLVQQNNMINSFRKSIGNSFEWDVAPLPVYKEYSDLNGDEVVNKGIEIGHSGGQGFGIWSQSKHKDEAFKVIEYLAGESAQKTISNRGYTMCNQRELAMTEYVAYQENSGNPPQNIRIFAEVCDTYRPADWWYMPDGAWIDEWANTLNQEVRNGDMTVDQFFAAKTDSTNAILKKYKQDGKV